MNRRQRVFAGVVIVLLLLSGGTTLWMATCGLAGCPSTEQLRGFRPNEGSRVLDRHGAALGRLAYVRRINVPLGRVPRHVQRGAGSHRGARSAAAAARSRTNASMPRKCACARR